MSEELKTAEPKDSPDSVKRMPPNAEVVKKAGLDLYADPKEPKDPKDRTGYDRAEMQKKQMEEDWARESRKKAMEQAIQGNPDTN